MYIYLTPVTQRDKDSASDLKISHTTQILVFITQTGLRKNRYPIVM